MKKNSSKYVVELPVDEATKRVISPFVRVIRKTPYPVELHDSRDEKDSIIAEPRKVVSIFHVDLKELPALLSETTQIMKTSTNADAVCLYMVNPAVNEIYLNQKSEEINERNRVNWKIQEGSTISAYVAYSKTYVMVEESMGHETFPLGVGYQDESVKSVLCVPILTPLEECVAVVELYRERSKSAFSEPDTKLSLMIAGWAGAAIHHNRQKLQLLHLQASDEFFVNLVDLFFASVYSLEKTIAEAMKFTKSTLMAMRGTFFIVDRDDERLMADIFEEGIEDNDVYHKIHFKVRLETDASVAGFVARTRMFLNLANVYDDPRFPKQVDFKTGIITRSVLCMPVISEGKVLGVVQLVNKVDDFSFTATDVEIFRKFTVYYALILHYAQLKRRIQKNRFAIESSFDLLNRQLPPCLHDLQDFTKRMSIDIPNEFDLFDWYISPEIEINIPIYIFYMLKEVLGTNALNTSTTMEFILTTKKFYRNIPYHNFEHAFNVTHCMYNILKRNLQRFTALEMKCMLIATLCHDVDHFGLTNNFLQATNHCLSQLYTDSPMEEHHYEVALILLNKYNIFTDLNSNEYKEMIENIRSLILMTDLMHFFKIRNKIFRIGASRVNWEEESHRTLIKGIMMTSCDLSGVCKPYPVAKKLIKNLYDEFYNQGDIEKRMNLVPLPLMDREKSDSVPEDQIQFLTVVVVPCVELLAIFLPNTVELCEQAMALKKNWQDIVEMRGIKHWKRDDSISNAINYAIL